MKDYTFEVKKEKDQFKEFVEKPKKQKIKEASFMVNNVSSAQNAIAGAIDIIGKIKTQPMAVGYLVGESIITGLDTIESHIDEKMMVKRKIIMVNNIIKNLMIYKKSLV